MLKQAVTQPAQFSEAAILASRQVWLAGLGAAVVTRDWVQHEAGTVFKTLVKEGTAVESRAIRLVGDSIETSVKRANGMWRQTRHTVETTVTRVRRHRGDAGQGNAAEVAAEDRAAVGAEARAPCPGRQACEEGRDDGQDACRRRRQEGEAHGQARGEAHCALQLR